MEVQVIRGYKLKINSIPHALNRQSVASAMKMSVKAPPDLIFFEKGKNLRAVIPLISWRIMQKNQFFRISRGFETGFQAN